MKFYTYSVKEVLVNYFGENIVENMLKPTYRMKYDECKDYLIELRWKFANEEFLKLLIDDYSLIEIKVEDDYIVYLSKKENQKYAFIMFMLTVPSFSMNEEYAKSIIEKWHKEGYKALIISKYVSAEFDESNELKLKSGYENNGLYFNISMGPTGKYGFLAKDGSWIVAPVFDSLYMSEDYLFKAIREINGENKQYLINRNGEIKPFDFDIDIEKGKKYYLYSEEKYAYNLYDGFYSDCYIFDPPGKWGVVNELGDIIIEAKYVYAIMIEDDDDNEYLIVAKYVDGKLCFGLIDYQENEIIPCIYYDLYYPFGFYCILAYKRHGDNLYGLMDTKGSIIVEPKFIYVDSYYPKRQVISIGTRENEVKVYSIEKDEILIDTTFYDIEYYENIISCIEDVMSKSRYFDYSGKELFFNDFDYIEENHGQLIGYKDKEVNYIDINGNIISK